MAARGRPDTDPENTRYLCHVCGVDLGVGEAGVVAWARHEVEPDHQEMVRDWQYGAARRMGNRAGLSDQYSRYSK